MPFWWRRRRKPWFGRWRKRWTTTRYKRRNTRRRKRRLRYANRRRRRRRRRGKVRRKKKRLILTQWQPDSIRKCKIKLIDTFIIGAQGTQFKCYTNEAVKYPPPKQPGGGGFGLEVFTLQDLYDRYRANKCIWTQSNDYTDLCRYTGTTFIFYRHPTTSFIISYSNSPPFLLDKYTYTQTHPLNMLLQRKKKILYSLSTKPWGPSRVKIRIRPPKQMISKWFFQKQFSTVGLMQIQATIADFNYSSIQNTSVSTNLSLYFLNTGFFIDSNWGKAIGTGPYLPFPTIKKDLKYWYKDRGTPRAYTPSTDTYSNSISYESGWFAPQILNAYSITNKDAESPDAAQAMINLPIGVARYNPQLDTGVGNEVWLTSILTTHYDKPIGDTTLIYTGRPLWMILWGYYNFILKAKGDNTFLNSYMFIFRSPAIKKLSGASTQDYYPLIDQSFLNGQMPYGEYLDANHKKFWYPSTQKQLEVINAIVQCGPFIPKFADNRESSWDLKYKSIFHFKWGGPQITDKTVSDPQKQRDYDVPDKFTETIQIKNPLKQTCETLFHNWDYRRGMLTNTAIKRMYENLESDSALSTDAPIQPHKKQRITAEIHCIEEKTKEVQESLLSLCEEPISPEEAPNLQQLILKQQQQQQHLKQHLLKLISNLKENQQMLQLQTGILS